MWSVLLLGLAWNHDAALTAKAFAEMYARPGMWVLDVGGRDVNGGARLIYEALGCNFTCLDIESDPSVDVVLTPGGVFPFPDGTFDLVVTSSSFEHDPLFWMTMREMARVTKMAGFIYNNAPSRGSYHGFPGDNYRFYYDAPAALAYWCGQEFGGARYPVEVEQQYFLGDVAWNMNVMVWQRTATPTPHFTMDSALQWRKSSRWSVPIPDRGGYSLGMLHLHSSEMRHVRASACLFCRDSGANATATMTPGDFQRSPPQYTSCMSLTTQPPPGWEVAEQL